MEIEKRCQQNSWGKTLHGAAVTESCSVIRCKLCVKPRVMRKHIVSGVHDIRSSREDLSVVVTLRMPFLLLHISRCLKFLRVITVATNAKKYASVYPPEQSPANLNALSHIREIRRNAHASLKCLMLLNHCVHGAAF